METKIENLISEILKNKDLGIKEFIVKDLKGKEFNSIFLIIKLNKKVVKVIDYLFNLKNDGSFKEIYFTNLLEPYIEFTDLESIYEFLLNFNTNLTNKI